MWMHEHKDESSGYRHCGGRGGRGHYGFGRFGGGGRGQGDGPGGFGRRRGLFDSEELRLVLLSLIGEQPRHGYDLIREIEERTGGAYAPSPGVVYPTLTMLQDMGLIAEESAAGTRKVYAATVEGKAYLQQRRAEADALLARIAEAGSSHKGDHAPVRRALRNLHNALMGKLSRVENDEAMHRIAALLDDVTQKIERS